MSNALSKGSIKLSFTTKFELEVTSEEELQMAIRNMPWIANTKPMGFTSGQSTVKVIDSNIHTLADGERQIIEETLKRCRTKTAAAKALNIQRCTLNSKIKQYGIEI